MGKCTVNTMVSNLPHHRLPKKYIKKGAIKSKKNPDAPYKNRKEAKEALYWHTSAKGKKKIKAIRGKRDKLKAREEKLVDRVNGKDMRAVKEKGVMPGDGKITKQERKKAKKLASKKQLRKIKRVRIKKKNKNWRIKKVRRKNQRSYLPEVSKRPDPREKNKSPVKETPKQETPEQETSTGTKPAPDPSDTMSWAARYNKGYDSWWD